MKEKKSGSSFDTDLGNKKYSRVKLFDSLVKSVMTYEM